MDLFEEIVKRQQQLTDLQLAYWQEHVLFDWRWWFLLALFIVPWLIWWRFADKSRLNELLLHGFFVMITVNILDQIGVTFTLWAYPHELLQVLPGLHPVDYAVLPVFYMLLYQWFSRWPSYLIAKTVAAGFYAFIAEPLFISLGIYKMIHWSHFYSFPIYVLIGVSFKWLSGKVNRAQHNNKQKQPV